MAKSPRTKQELLNVLDGQTRKAPREIGEAVAASIARRAAIREGSVREAEDRAAARSRAKEEQARSAPEGEDEEVGRVYTCVLWELPDGEFVEMGYVLTEKGDRADYDDAVDQGWKVHRTREKIL